MLHHLRSEHAVNPRYLLIPMEPYTEEDTPLFSQTAEVAFFQAHEQTGYSCWPLSDPDPFLIGRCDLCDLILTSHRVSRLHACIVWRGSQYRIEDLQSKNGTHVNGFVVKSQPLHHGDEIQLGLCCKLLFIDTAQLNKYHEYPALWLTH